MRLVGVRFMTNEARSAGVGYGFLKVGGNCAEQADGQARGHRDDAGETGQPRGVFKIQANA